MEVSDKNGPNVLVVLLDDIRKDGKRQHMTTMNIACCEWTVCQRVNLGIVCWRCCPTSQPRAVLVSATRHGHSFSFMFCRDHGPKLLHLIFVLHVRGFALLLFAHVHLPILTFSRWPWIKRRTHHTSTCAFAKCVCPAVVARNGRNLRHVTQTHMDTNTRSRFVMAHFWIG